MKNVFPDLEPCEAVREDNIKSASQSLDLDNFNGPRSNQCRTGNLGSLCGNVESQPESLIICNSDLASSFGSLKPGKYNSNPGHYLRKVFLNKVAQKFRSQSLPNSLEKKKILQTQELEDSNEPFSPLLCSSIESSEEYPKASVVNDTRFKTWPERGIDNSLDNKSKLKGKMLIYETNEYKYEKINPSCLSTSIYEAGKNCIGAHQIILNDSGDKSDYNCGRVSLCRDNECHECKTNADEFSNITHSPIPLNELLDNISLAYSPVTKTLCVISNNDTNDGIGDCQNQLMKGSKTECNTICCSEEAEPSVTDVNCQLSRVNTEVSLFSSTVSSLSDNSPSPTEDSAFGSLIDRGDTGSLFSIGACSIHSEDSVGEKNTSKSRGLASFFSRAGVFGWKLSTKDDAANCSATANTGWSLFGKSSPSPSLDALSQVTPDSPGSSRSSTPARGHTSRVASSTALIQLDRPAELPAKSRDEALRHKLQYQQILDTAKRKEVKEAKLRKKLMQQQRKLEEESAHATRIWTHDILPKWKELRDSRKTSELWWQGVPPCVRGKVWRLAITNDLNLTNELYDICVTRAQDLLRGNPSSVGNSGDDDNNKEDSVGLIQLDISRTFPHLCIFQKGGPYYDMLHCLLAAYVCYRPDVGYVQGMSFIAAVLLLNMDAPDAFVCFSNLLNQPCHMAFYRLNQPLMEAYYATYNAFFKENLPQLYSHFSASNLTPDLYLLDWLYTVFTKAMNLDLACRVWDVFLRDGDSFLFRTAIGVLHLNQPVLLGMDFVRGSQYLTRLPDDLASSDLFRSIASVRMTIGKQTFQQILTKNMQTHTEAHL